MTLEAMAAAREARRTVREMAELTDGTSAELAMSRELARTERRIGRLVRRYRRAAQRAEEGTE